MEASLSVAVALVLAAWVSLELRITSAFLEIVAGVILAAMFGDMSELNWLHFLANLGVVALMFTAGFEVDMRRLRWMWRGCLTLGASAFVVPLAAVFTVAYLWMGLPLAGAGVVAIGLSTTSLALVYQALKEKGMLRTGEGQALLAGATVVDVLSMVSLAFLMGDFGWGSATVVLVVVGTAVGLPRVGKWVFWRYSGSLAEPELRFLLLVIMGMGFLAESVGGIHPAVVAFAIGVAMSRVVVEHEAVEQKLKGVVFGLFAPVFFFRAGTELEISAITPEVLMGAGVLLVVALAAKFAGTYAPARWMLGIDGVRAGLAFNYRLSFGVIAAGAGLSSGLIDQSIYAMMLLVVLVSALVPALALRDAPRVRPPAEETDESRSGTAP